MPASQPAAVLPTPDAPPSALARFFRLRENGTDVRREIIAGVTTFAAMAYILAVNPSILSVSGMDKGAVLTATALAAAFTTLAMALFTNYPLALAPGMGLNAFFAFTMCLGEKVPWQSALGLVFWEGVIFLALSLGGVRRKIVEAIPQSLKIAIGCGIGLFIAFIGMKNGGLIVANPATFVGLGDLRQPAVWLVLLGIVLTAILIGRKVRGAIILSVLILTLIGLAIPALPGSPVGPKVTNLPAGALVGAPASLAPTFFKLDLTYLFTHFAKALPLMLTLLVVDLFDNLGTLIAVTKRAGLLDKDGNLPRIGRVLTADAGAAMFGACLGTSTTTSYIESAAGVEEGGRTGLTTVVVSALFLLALFFTPLILAIPAAATAPALVIVGVFMMQSVTEIDWKDFAVAVPAALTILTMPLTFSISEGIAVGFFVYVLLMLGLGRARQVSWLAYALGAMFALHFLTR
jgi:AGZA family xanthine/uracil permease-like MFS transporter